MGKLGFIAFGMGSIKAGIAAYPLERKNVALAAAINSDPEKSAVMLVFYRPRPAVGLESRSSILSCSPICAILHHGRQRCADGEPVSVTLC